MIRVLNVVGSFEVGGTERYLARIAPLLRRHGVAVEFCALEARGALLDSVTKDFPVIGTSYICRAGRSNTKTLLEVIGQIRSLVRRERYAIVHTYLFWSDVLGVIGARLGGCHRVIESRRALHGWRHDPTRFQHALELGTNVLADELIANSRFVLDEVLSTERFVPRTRRVIYNGIDPAHYRRATPARSAELRLVTVGALANRKGHEYGIHALRRVLDAGVATHLTVVGGGPDRRLLEELTANLGLTANITFAGEHGDPRPFLEAADMFVLPSRQEGFSNAVLEAMASWLPVIATDVGGNREAVIDGEGGRIVPAFDAAALANAIIDLAAERDTLRTMGAVNRARVEEHFTLEASAAALAGWYSRS